MYLGMHNLTSNAITNAYIRPEQHRMISKTMESLYWISNSHYHSNKARDNIEYDKNIHRNYYSSWTIRV